MFLCQTLVLTHQVLHPLQPPPSQGEVLGVPKENPLKGMERFTPLIPWWIWDHIFNVHVTIVQANNWYLIILFILIIRLLFAFIVVFPCDMWFSSHLNSGAEYESN